MVEKCRNNGIMGLGNQDKGGFSPSFTFGGQMMTPQTKERGDAVW